LNDDTLSTHTYLFFR
jgi:hypothetical protein